jgi:hypothetical protein
MRVCLHPAYYPFLVAITSPLQAGKRWFATKQSTANLPYPIQQSEGRDAS